MTQNAVTSWVGERLGNYELNDLLGEGGMASVYAASHIALGTDHAVKILAPSYARHPDVRARFLREGRVQAQFRHPGIAQVTDTIQGPCTALVMERLRGESIRDVLDRGPMSLTAAVLVVQGVAAALEHAHERHVVHRDVKPENIFLATDFRGDVRPVLLDFGVARVQTMNSLTRSGIMIGTPRYMSPEQFDDPRNVDGRSDQFALAAAFFEMVTGFSPHPGDTPPAIAMSKLEGRFHRLSDHRSVPPAMDAVLERGLAPEPTVRFASTEDFAVSLRVALGDGERIETPHSLDRPTLQTPALTWPPVPEEEVEALLADRDRPGRTLGCPQCRARNPPKRTTCRRCGASLS